MPTAGDIVTSAFAQGGIDASPADGLGWLNDRYKRLVAGSKWHRRERDLGPTVADQARYAVAADVVDVLAVRVASGPPLTLIDIEELWELESGVLRVSGSGGFFSNAYDDTTSSESVAIYPPPATAGQTITALCAVTPADLDTGDTPDLPDDMVQKLREGIIADGLALVDEDIESAAYHEQEFQNAIEQLRIRRVSRVGRGPNRIRVRR